MPQIHKTPVASRPIVPTFGTLLSKALIWVDHALQPLLSRYNWVLLDSRTLRRELFELELNLYKRHWLITGDAVSLYPNIPMGDGINTVVRLLKGNRPSSKGTVQPELLNRRSDLVVALF